MPKASSRVVSVSCACETGAAKPSVSEGRAGRYRSVVTGWIPSSSDNTRTTRPGVMAGLAVVEAVGGAADIGRG